MAEINGLKRWIIEFFGINLIYPWVSELFYFGFNSSPKNYNYEMNCLFPGFNIPADFD